MHLARFFADVKLAAGEKPFLKIPSKLKEPLKKAKEEFEAQLKSEQKAVSRIIDRAPDKMCNINFN